MTTTIDKLIEEFGQAYHIKEIQQDTMMLKAAEEKLARAYGRLTREIEQELYNAKHGISVINILDPEKITS